MGGALAVDSMGAVLSGCSLPEEDMSRLTPPTMFSLSTADGGPLLLGAYFAPDAARFGDGPYPTVVSV